MHPTVENRSSDFSMFTYHNMVFPDHLHTQFELMIPSAGVLRTRVSGKEYEVHPGEALIVFPNTLHSYEQGEQTQGITLIFSSMLLPDLGFDFNNIRPVSPVVKLNTEDLRYATSRLREICLSPLYDDIIINALLHLLMAGIIPKPQMEAVPFTPVSDLLYQALAYISKHAAKPLTIKNVAHAIGVNEFYLSHLMNDRLHMGFRTYLNTLRIDKAKRLLCNTSKPIEEIGLICGFQTLRTFDRVFQQHCDFSPREFRKSYLQSATAPTN